MSDLDYPKKLLELGDVEGAIKDLKNIVRCDRTNFEVWLLLGSNIKDEEQAKYCFEQVLQLAPTNIKAKEYLREYQIKHEIGASIQPSVLDKVDAPLNLLTQKPSDRKIEEATGLSETRLANKPNPVSTPRSRKRSFSLPGLIALFIVCVLGVILVTVWVVKDNSVLLAPFIPLPSVESRPIVTNTFYPTALGSKLIKGEAISYIPVLSEMPKGYSLDPKSGPLPYANADGYSQIYRNPNFIQNDREVFVGYFLYIFDGSEDASRILSEFLDVMLKESNCEMHETEAVQDEKLAKVDAAEMIFCESKTQSGNYNISYLTGVRYSNFMNVVLVIVPVDDPDSERGKVIQERLREVSYYYTSLVTQKLPIPGDSKISLPEPEYQRVLSTATP